MEINDSLPHFCLDKWVHYKYQENPYAFIQHKYNQRQNFIYINRTSVCSYDMAIVFLKKVLTHNRRCELKARIRANLQPFRTTAQSTAQPTAIARPSSKCMEALLNSGANMDNHKLLAVIEPLLSYYGITLNEYFGTALDHGQDGPFRLESRPEVPSAHRSEAPDVNEVRFLYRLNQLSVYELENEIRNDLSSLAKVRLDGTYNPRGYHIEIPDRVIEREDIEF